MTATAATALTPASVCERLSQRPDLLRNSALLQDFTTTEADMLGTAMQLVRAGPGQVLIAESTVND